MKVFVTVGSSPFDSLVKTVDESIACKGEIECVFQISHGQYLPKNGKYFDFSDVFHSYVNECDVVITHAGAGTIFYLLDQNKRFVAVPNLERIDKHQADLANYIKNNGLALVCNDLTSLASIFDQLSTFCPAYYEKDSFFVANELIALF
ncbi:PssE/Cps14G family polysaccharide biosynthesis glycosyltransferase [Pseudoalteromonas fenneropenaei]|uniref:PssE/Cps14G family polysaccharide biosynthesis glycosyltransferase n=1 Tax=Pseudoalteromonas fenneropenaei TaxID=1737459 RepID=A0ABV7CKJ7_9GAMM